MPKSSVVINGVTLTRAQVESALVELNREDLVGFPVGSCVITFKGEFGSTIEPLHSAENAASYLNHHALFLRNTVQWRPVTWELRQHPNWPEHQILVGVYQ